MGVVFIVVNIEVISIALVLPLAIVLLDLDPYIDIFELLLPPRNDRDWNVILVIFWTRLIVLTVFVIEFLLFLSMATFLLISLFFTITTCLKRHIHQHNLSEWTTAKLYTQFRLILSPGDFVIRHFVGSVMIFVQIVVTLFTWLVVKLSCCYSYGCSTSICYTIYCRNK